MRPMLCACATHPPAREFPELPVTRHLFVGPMDFPVADRRGSGADDRSGRILPRILFKSLIRAKRR